MLQMSASSTSIHCQGMERRVVSVTTPFPWSSFFGLRRIVLEPCHRSLHDDRCLKSLIAARKRWRGWRAQRLERGISVGAKAQSQSWVTHLVAMALQPLAFHNAEHR